MMDKKFIEELRKFDMLVDYENYQAYNGLGELKTFEAYTLKTTRLNKVLSITCNGDGWCMDFLKDATSLSNYDIAVIFEIMAIIERKVKGE